MSHLSRDHVSDLCSSRLRTAVVVATVAFAGVPAVGMAQSRTLTACTPDVLAVCAEVRLMASPGFFEIALRTIGSTTDPALAVSFYNMVLATGGSAASLPVSTLLPPAAEGGAVVSDPSDWEVFDAGDALFVSAWSNRGVGGCVAGADVGGFGQAVTTCGAGQFATFGFVPTRVFDVRQFTILDLEAVALTSPALGASCGAPGSECVITADASAPTTAPEPATLALLAAGLLGLGVTGGARPRRGRA